MDIHQQHRTHWHLNPEIAFLNHGSFGATPKAILQKQREIQDLMEHEPVQFMLRELPERRWENLVALGDFVSAKPEDIALVPNATDGVNAVLRSLGIEKGDEILFVDQVYGACRKTAEVVTSRTGGYCRSVPLPMPVIDPQEIVERVCAAWTPSVKVLLLDHICSPSGWILPVEDIIVFYESKGTPVLLDAAHSLGQVPLNLMDLGASFVVANAHKWLCTPKGAAMLYVRPDRQSQIHPNTISQWVDWENPTDSPQYSPFQMAFAWTGTRDQTAQLCIKDSIHFMGQLYAGGWAELQQSNTGRSRHFRRRLLDRWGDDALCPDSMVGHLGSVLLPDIPMKLDASLVPVGQGLDPLWGHLFRDFGIEVVVFPFQNRKVLRFSIQTYVQDADLDRLWSALGEIGM